MIKKQYLKYLSLTITMCPLIALSQNIGVNTDGSLPSTLFHTKNTVAGADNILRIENTIGNRETGLSLLNSTTANANWKFYIPASSDALRLYNGSDLVTFLQNGNVGIGTTTPLSRLSVAQSVSGSIATSGSSDLSQIAILYGSNIGAGGGGLHIGAHSSDGAAWLQSRRVDDFSVNYPLLINPNGGNVGIGITNPAEKLHIRGAGTQRLMIEESGNNVKTKIVATDNRGYIGTESNHPLRIGTNDQDYLNILTNGNIGIGTTSPSYRLHVNDPTLTTVACFSSGNASNSGIVFMDAGTTFGSAIYSNNDDLTFWTGGNSNIRLKSNGRVGIGSGVNPQNTLQIGSVSNGYNGNAFMIGNGSYDFAINPIVGQSANFYTGSAFGFAFLNSGGGSSSRVGIGTWGMGYLFAVNGEPAANGYTAFTNWSDARLKKNVSDIDNCLEKIMQLHPVQYSYNERYMQLYDDSTATTRLHKGFIAQEVKEIFPEMVGIKEYKNQEYYDLNLSNLQVYLVKAMQEQQKIIEDLKREVEILKHQKP